MYSNKGLMKYWNFFGCNFPQKIQCCCHTGESMCLLVCLCVCVCVCLSVESCCVSENCVCMCVSLSGKSFLL
jgi:hypothetical protein